MKRLALYAVCGLLLFEITLHWVDASPVMAVRAAIDPASTARELAPVTPHPYLAFANKRDWTAPTSGAGAPVRHGALGFRGGEVAPAKPAGVRRIVCLGGTGTYGPAPAGTDWPARLGALLGADSYEVINAGTPGYTSVEFLIDFALRLGDLEPDVLVVRPDVDDARATLASAPERDQTHWRAVWEVRNATVLERCFGWSWTWRAGRALLAGAARDGAYPDSLVRTAAPPASAPPHPEALRHFARNLEQLIVLATEQGARVVLLTRLPPLPGRDGGGAGAAEAVATRALNDVLRTLAETSGTACLDIAAQPEPPGPALVDASGLPSAAGDEHIATIVASALGL